MSTNTVPTTSGAVAPQGYLLIGGGVSFQQSIKSNTISLVNPFGDTGGEQNIGKPGTNSIVRAYLSDPHAAYVHFALPIPTSADAYFRQRDRKTEHTRQVLRRVRR
jgi:hypothetical protein